MVNLIVLTVAAVASVLYAVLSAREENRRQELRRLSRAAWSGTK